MPLTAAWCLLPPQSPQGGRGEGGLAGRCCIGVCCVPPLFIAGVPWSKMCPVGSCVVEVKSPCLQRGRFPRSLPSLGVSPGRCNCAASRSSMSLMERFLFRGRLPLSLPSLGVRVGRPGGTRGCDQATRVVPLVPYVVPLIPCVVPQVPCVVPSPPPCHLPANVRPGFPPPRGSGH